MSRYANNDWQLPEYEGSAPVPDIIVMAAVLMDIRDSLHRIESQMQINTAATNELLDQLVKKPVIVQIKRPWWRFWE